MIEVILFANNSFLIYTIYFTLSKDICRRVINFDIDQNLLKANYPYSSKIHGPKTYTNAYGKIQKYMESHGFSHRQYSTYDSNEPIPLERVYEVVSGLINQNVFKRLMLPTLDNNMI